MIVAGVTLLTVFGLTGCGANTATPKTSYEPCPTTPIKVVVTIDVWASVTDQLAGACAQVVTIVSSASADPHEFEPTAQTSDTFAQADLAIVNGLGYDEWANKIIASLGAQAPAKLDLGRAMGLTVGANPHIWYSPNYVSRATKEITQSLVQQNGPAHSYFTGQAKGFAAALKPYFAQVHQLKAKFAGTKVTATETVFDYMITATGLRLITPAPYLRAVAQESNPSAQAMQQFRNQLERREPKVLIYNPQTDSGLATELRTLAETNQIPVVNVTETIVPQGATFQQWQLAQLGALSQALEQV